MSRLLLALCALCVLCGKSSSAQHHGAYRHGSARSPGHRQLFNLAANPAEQHDLVASDPQSLHRLAALCEDLNRRMAPPAPTPRRFRPVAPPLRLHSLTAGPPPITRHAAAITHPDARPGPSHGPRTNPIVMVEERLIDQLLHQGPEAWASSDLLHRMLGASIEYLEGDLERVLRAESKPGRNVVRVLAAAMRKLGPRLARPGAVNPRVLMQAWAEGCRTEDAVAAEYLGGILAAARTTLGRDDRALPFVHLLCQLSVYDLRLHYLFYNLFRRLYQQNPIDLGARGQRQRSFVYIPLTLFQAAVERQNNGAGHLPAIVEQAIQSLTGRKLLGEDYAIGPARFLARGYPGVRESGFILQPSALGARLYLFAHGLADTPVRDLLSAWIKLKDFQDFTIAPGAMPFGPPRQPGSTSPDSF